MESRSKSAGGLSPARLSMLAAWILSRPIYCKRLSGWQVAAAMAVLRKTQQQLSLRDHSMGISWATKVTGDAAIDGDKADLLML